MVLLVAVDIQKEILKILGKDGVLIASDQDADAIENAEKKIDGFDAKKHIVHSNFIDIDKILKNLKIKKIDGMILDLGYSLNQIKKSKRGFSFLADEMLDMRMDIRCKSNAFDVFK